MSMMLVDPPSGWKYGFPKEVPEDYLKKYFDIEQWFLDNGYPQKLIDQGMLKHCRYIFQGNEEVEGTASVAPSSDSYNEG